jgi:hypothetical protein
VFDRTYSLAKIAERAALPIERLRYVIDSRILPGRRHLKPGAGASNPGRAFRASLPRTKRLLWLSSCSCWKGAFVAESSKIAWIF